LELLQRRCSSSVAVLRRKHETDGTEPKREEDETELPKASSAPSQHKRELQANGETGGTKREKKKSGDISFEAYFCQIFNDAYDLNFKNSVEAMGSRLHVKLEEMSLWLSPIVQKRSNSVLNEKKIVTLSKRLRNYSLRMRPRQQ